MRTAQELALEIRVKMPGLGTAARDHDVNKFRRNEIIINHQIGNQLKKFRRTTGIDPDIITVVAVNVRGLTEKVQRIAVNLLTGAAIRVINQLFSQNKYFSSHDFFLSRLYGS